MMKQKQYTPLCVSEIAISLFAVEKGYCDDLSIDKITDFEKGLHNYAKSNYKDFMSAVNSTGNYDNEVEKTFHNILTEFKKMR